MRGFPDTIYPNVTTQTRLTSDTADNICWFKFAPSNTPNAQSPAHTPIVQSALMRMEFKNLSSPVPLHILGQTVAVLAEAKRTIVIAGRGKRLAVESHQDEMQTILGPQSGAAHAGLGNEMRKTLGDVSTAFVVQGVSAGLLVMQASSEGKDMSA